MAIRSNHYDAAFEEYLRGTGTPYVAVDERRRALLAGESLKSMDFIVHSREGKNLLVDVKGRRFPSGGDRQRHKWENWATEDDLTSLLQWERVFGDGFRAVLVFAYDIVESRWLAEFDGLFEHGERCYAFYGVWADEYFRAMRSRSASWETVTLPSRAYRDLRAPIVEFL